MKLWRIELDCDTVQSGIDKLPISVFHMLTYHDFNKDTFVYYPFPFSLIIAFSRWVKLRTYITIKKLREEETVHEVELRCLKYTILEMNERHQDELAEAYRKGRDFEFKTMNVHCEAFYKRKLNDNERTELGIIRASGE